MLDMNETLCCNAPLKESANKLATVFGYLFSDNLT